MKNLRITYNQIELLDMIYSFRYIPLKVLVKMSKRRGIYSSIQSLSISIIKLEKRGILKSFYYGNNWKVVYITKKGAELLADIKNLDIKDVRVPNQGMKVQFAMLEHTVKISEFYEKFVSELQNYPQVILNKWLGDQRLLLQYSFHSTKSSKMIRRNLIPDSYIELELDNNKYNYFLEYDTGTMDKNQLARKFMRYFEYFVYGDWKDRFEVFPIILFLTDRSKDRLQNLLTESDKFDLDKALLNRYHFRKADHIMTKAIAMSDNVRNIDSNKITEFLNLSNIFTFTSEPWQKELLEQLY